MRRIVHCGGDATGKETTMQLGRIALERENLHFFFESYLIDILTEGDSVSGVLIHVGDDYKVLRKQQRHYCHGRRGDRCMNTLPIRSERWATGLPLLPVQARR